jgi:hypothetical protein
MIYMIHIDIYDTDWIYMIQIDIYDTDWLIYMIQIYHMCLYVLCMVHMPLPTHSHAGAQTQSFASVRQVLYTWAAVQALMYVSTCGTEMNNNIFLSEKKLMEICLQKGNCKIQKLICTKNNRIEVVQVLLLPFFKKLQCYHCLFRSCCFNAGCVVTGTRHDLCLKQTGMVLNHWELCMWQTQCVSEADHVAGVNQTWLPNEIWCLVKDKKFEKWVI